MTPFVFTSTKLPGLKAKQLRKAFPFLKLSQAQEATARALGYADWYECTHRGTDGRPSASDQDAGLETRISRYYHQASALIALGITPPDADVWVRGWGLTGSPTLAPAMAVPTYYRWLRDVGRLERGELSDEEIALEWQEADWSKYPSVDRPMQVCQGVILAPCGKYPHYAVDPAIQARTPIHLRGSGAIYHLEDEHDVVSMMVPDFQSGRRPPIGDRFNLLTHEWHFGQKHPDARAPMAPQLIAAARAVPDAMVIVTYRFMPTSDGGMSSNSYAIACLPGAEFASFVESKGVFDPTKLVWYANVDREDFPANDLYGWLVGMSPELDLPVFEAARKLKPSQPIYSYPFKVGPMASEEFYDISDRQPLLPLSVDYRDDDDDDDGEDDSLGSEGDGRILSPEVIHHLEQIDLLRQRVVDERGSEREEPLALPPAQVVH